MIDRVFFNNVYKYPFLLFFQFLSFSTTQTFYFCSVRMIISLSFYALIFSSLMINAGSSPIYPPNTVFFRRSEGSHSRSTSKSHTSTHQSPPSSPRLRDVKKQTLPVVQTRARFHQRQSDSSTGLRSPVQRSSPLRPESTNSPNSVLKSYSAFDYHFGN